MHSPCQRRLLAEKFKEKKKIQAKAHRSYHKVNSVKADRLVYHLKVFV